MTIRDTRAALLADRARDNGAYSAARYGEAWVGCAALLLGRMNDAEAEAVLRSKHMRYAADEFGASDDSGTVEALEAYMAKYPKSFTPAALAELVEGTF